LSIRVHGSPNAVLGQTASHIILYVSQRTAE
jgi:hypothetical protein